MNANIPTLVSKAQNGFVAQVWENQTTHGMAIEWGQVVLALSLTILLAGQSGSQSLQKLASLSSLVSSNGKSMGHIATKVAEFKETFPVGGIDFNSDGTELATNAMVAGLDTDIWDWSKGHIVRVLHKTAPAGEGNAIRYSADGKLLAVGHMLDTKENGLGLIRIWNTQTGEVVHDIQEPQGAGGTMGLAFTPDGKFLVRTVDRGRNPGNTLIVQKTDSWEAAWGLSTLPFFANSLALSSDGQSVAIAGATGKFGPPLIWYPKILIVDLQSRQVVRTIEQAFPNDNEIHSLAWSPNGKQLAAGTIVQGSFAGPDAVKIFDATTGTQIAHEPADFAYVSGLVYSPDSRYVIEGYVDRAVRIWDSSHNTLLQEIPVDIHSRTVLSISRDSRYLAIAEGEHISVWQLN
jgi:WD40 repeat protein